MIQIRRPVVLASVLLVLGLACDRGGSTDAKTSPETKTTETKTTETKMTETKTAETKTGDTKAADTKAAEPAPSGTDYCALFTRERAAQALKSPVQAGERLGKGCKWKAETGPGSVTIEVTETGGASVYDHELQLLGSDATLAGIGDRAFRSGMIVGVHKGERYIAIGVAPNIGSGPMARFADAEALARDVVAALP